MHPLDNPVHRALTTVHARFAQRAGRALRYPAEMTPFFALPDDPLPADWDAAAELLGAEGGGALVLPDGGLPPSWRLFRAHPCLQMLGPTGGGAPDPEAVTLGPGDVPEMLDLVARTEPGPFGPRTIELGNYLGIRRDGALVAMAGERMHPAGYTEVSAVCTDPNHRGAGFAARLMGAVIAGITARGEQSFLHVMTTNASAIRVYERLGFNVRRELAIAAVGPVPRAIA